MMINNKNAMDFNKQENVYSRDWREKIEEKWKGK